MSMKLIVIYHRADFDGIFSREIARIHFGDGADYIGWDYGDPVPAVEADDVIYMIDISIEPLMGHPNLIWIDHHKSAIEKYGEKINGWRMDGVAACRLAWRWFNHTAAVASTTKADFVERRVEEPIAVRLAGEYDVFDHRDPRALLFQLGLKSLELEGRWAELLSTQRPTIAEVEGLQDVGHQHMIEPDGTIPPAIVWAALERGEVLLTARTKENKSVITKQGFTVVFEGLTFLACNAARFNSFLFTAGLRPEHDGCLGFCWDGGKGKWKVSMYGAPGKPDIDFSVIASRYGGGGHKQACGFECLVLPFVLGGGA